MLYQMLQCTKTNALQQCVVYFVVLTADAHLQGLQQQLLLQQADAAAMRAELLRVRAELEASHAQLAANRAELTSALERWAIVRAELAHAQRQLAMRFGDAPDLLRTSAADLADLEAEILAGLAKVKAAQVR